MKKNEAIRMIAFLLIFAILFHSISQIFVAADYRNYQWVRGFYAEKEDSLDAVCIGSSKMYAYWNPLEAWSEYGIAAFPYTSSSQHFLAAEYIIKEARKTQPDALFIVSVNSIGNEEEFGRTAFHYLLDYMPFSMNKLRLTKHLADVGEHTFIESLELYFPIIRYHSRWNELEEENFVRGLDGLKGANQKNDYLEVYTDISKEYNPIYEKEELYDSLQNGLVNLLDYCGKENVKVLFMAVPCVESEEARINTMKEYILERGYPVLDLREHMKEIGLDLTQDYYNARHTNIHGSIKLTQYVSEYLSEHYEFKDKRGEEEYSSWNDAVQNYWEIIKYNILDFEWKPSNRNYSLEAVTNLAAEWDELGITINWDATDMAEQYAIYRKGNEEGWHQIDIIEECHFHDDEVETGGYSYRIVPICEKDGQLYFGKFSYEGITVINEQVKE